MRKSVVIFCLGCLVGAVTVGGAFAQLWQKAEIARQEAVEAQRQAEEARQRADDQQKAAAEAHAALAAIERQRAIAVTRDMLAEAEKAMSEKAKRD